MNKNFSERISKLFSEHENTFGIAFLERGIRSQRRPPNLQVIFYNNEDEISNRIKYAQNSRFEKIYCQPFEKHSIMDIPLSIFAAELYLVYLSRDFRTDNEAIEYVLTSDKYYDDYQKLNDSEKAKLRKSIIDEYHKNYDEYKKIGRYY